MTPPRHALSALLSALPSLSPACEAAATPTPSPTPTVEAIPIVLREVISLHPAHLARLPLPTTLRLTAGAFELTVTSSRTLHAALHAAGQAVLTARELCMLAEGAENGRSSRDVFLCWLEMEGPLRGSPPIENVAYGGAYALQTPNQRWPIGRVLDAWGLTLVNVIVGDGPDSEVML